MNEQEKARDWKIGIVVFDGVEELDFAGPWEMLRMWGQVADGPETCRLVAERTAPVVCAKGLSVNPQVDFAACPALDLLLVPGGQGTRREATNPAMLDFVLKQAAQAKVVMSVCTGAFVLHAAGLLEGRRATTYWGSLQRLRDAGGATVVEERYVRDGNVWTSAGVSAGIDMALAVIADLAGDDAAGKVQFGAEYYPSAQRYGGQAVDARAPAYVRLG